MIDWYVCVCVSAVFIVNYSTVTTQTECKIRKRGGERESFVAFYNFQNAIKCRSTQQFWCIEKFYAFTKCVRLWCWQPAWPLFEMSKLFFGWLFFSSRSSSISNSICLFLISGPHLNRMRSRTKGINYFSHEMYTFWRHHSTKCDCHSEMCVWVSVSFSRTQAGSYYLRFFPSLAFYV